MKNGKSPHYYLAIFWFLLTITLLCSGATPERPYYSETPNPRHIQNNDRLTAEYFNNQLNVIYNWAQRTHTELDNLLHNGVGVASLTVGILNCTNKIINPEWDNLLHNGNGVASITANLIKTQELEISNKIDVPAIEFSGRSQPTPPVNNGLLYFDSDLQRFRVYQENAWRDLSSNYIINGTTLTNPLVIDGYLDTRNIYINENASISKNLNVQGNINSSGTTTVTSLNTDKVLKVPTSASTTLGVGSIYYDTTAGKLKAYNGTSWDIVGKDITVDSAMSSTSTNPVQNKVIYNKIYTLNTNMLASLSAGLDAAEASATRLVNTASSSFNTKLQNASSSLNTQFNNAITDFDNSIKAYVSEKLGSGTSDLWVKSIKTTNASITAKLDSKKIKVEDIEITNSIAIPPYNGFLGHLSEHPDYAGLWYHTASNTIGFSHVTNGNLLSLYTLAKESDIPEIKTGSTDGTIAVIKNGSTTYIPVKGLGSAAYANVASFSTAGAANSIPTTQPSNPSEGSIYWSTADGCIKVYIGGSWKRIFPQENIVNTTPNTTYIQNSMYAYDSETPRLYDFVTGEITAPNYSKSYCPMLQESTDGTNFTNVTGYSRGHFYCLGYSVISDDGSHEILKMRIVFPITSVILATSVVSYGGSTVKQYIHFLKYQDINNLANTIRESRGNNNLYPRINTVADYGTFGIGTGYVLNYNNKYYRFDFRTNNSDLSINTIKFDSGFILSDVTYVNDLVYSTPVTSDYFRISGSFSETNNYETSSSGNQTYYFGTGAWADIIVDRYY